MPGGSRTSYLKKLAALKSASRLPKKIVFFASMIALQDWWKMLFISA